MSLELAKVKVDDYDPILEVYYSMNLNDVH